MIRRGGPYDEVAPSARPRRLLPEHFGLRGGMQIFIKTLTGKTITINDLTEGHIVFSLKTLIRIKLYLPTDVDFYLIFTGQRLNNHNTLDHYNIMSGSTVWMVMRLRGGMDAGAHCKNQIKTRFLKT